MKTRVCKCCESEYPLSESFFTATNRERTTFRWVCINCQHKKEKDYREERKAANDDRMMRFRESQRKWKKTHPDQNMAQIVRRRRERQKEDPVYKWEQEARRAVRSSLNKHKSAHFSDNRVKEITGLTKAELREHLLKTYRETYGYDWDFSEHTHVDHIIPLCTENTLDGKKRLFNYSNLRLVKETDNWAKGTSLDYQIGGDTSC